MQEMELRFPRFKEKVEVKQLGNYLIHAGSGVTPRGGSSVYQTEGIMLIRSQNVHNIGLQLEDVVYITEETHLKMKNSEVYSKDVLLNITGASIGRCAIVPNSFPKANVNQHVCILRTTEELDPSYLKNFLESNVGQKNIFQDQAGQTREALNLNQIRSFKIGVPSIVEQKKVGAFFSLINNKVKKQQEKVELLKQQKKGLMQKIFSQELRFKDENGQEYPKWTYKHLNELVTPIKGNLIKDISTTSLPVLSISAKVGFIDQKDRFSQVIAGNSLSKYTALQKYDLSYNKGNSKAAKYGCVYMLDTYEEALVPNVYKSFRAKNNADPLYLQYYFSSKLPDKELKKVISSTARMDGLLNVSDADFFKIPILSPNFEEQVKISSFLSSLEIKIRKEENKFSTLEEQKNGFMQQMFL